MAAVTKLKVVLLGDSAVGKSSIVLRFVRGEFTPNSLPTVGAAFLIQTIHKDDRTIKLEIWDTAGQEKFHGLAPLYYHGAHMALVVYDITDLGSFGKAKSWVDELQQHAAEDIIIALAGNKTDLEAQRAVQNKEAKDYAKEHDFLFFETSAKSGTGITELFVDSAMKAVQTQQPAMKADPIHVQPTDTGRQKQHQSDGPSKGCC